MAGKKIAYFDCFSGIAGDMALGALIDAGLSIDALTAGLESIVPLKGEWKLEAKRIHKGSGMISATKVDVWSIYDHPEKFGLEPRVADAGTAAQKAADAAEGIHHGNPLSHAEAAKPDEAHGHGHGHGHGHSEDHGHGHSHGHSEGHGHGHSEGHGHGHSEGHGHGHTHDGDCGCEEAETESKNRDEAHGHSHGHNAEEEEKHGHGHSHGHAHGHSHGHAHGDGPMRGYPEIKALLDASALSEQVKRQSLAAFMELAKAEARVHGMSVEDVHFHEVGAVDSIIDTVGVVLGLELMGVLGDGNVYCSSLPYTSGFVRCQHGLMPVPAPATLELLCGVPTFPCPAIRGELITPTGACLLRGLVSDDKFGIPPPFVPQATGYGAGTKEFGDRPNCVRVVIGTVGGSGQNIKAATVSRPKIGEAPAPAPMPAPAPTMEPVPQAHGHGHAHARDDAHGHGHAHAHGDAHGHGHEHAHDAVSTDAGNEAAAARTSSDAVTAADTARTDRARLLEQAGTTGSTTAVESPDDAASLQSDELLQIEANLDDINPQLFESIIANLLAAGARDAWVTNVLMKKGRPAFMLCTLCDDNPTVRSKVLEIYLTQSSTLGVRIQRVERLSIARRFETLTTPYGVVSVKLGVWGDRVVNVHPEYEDCKARAAECNVPIKEVFAQAEAAAAHLHSSG